MKKLYIILLFTLVVPLLSRRLLLHNEKPHDAQAQPHGFMSDIVEQVFKDRRPEPVVDYLNNRDNGWDMQASRGLDMPKQTQEMLGSMDMQKQAPATSMLDGMQRQTQIGMLGDDFSHENNSPKVRAEPFPGEMMNGENTLSKFISPPIFDDRDEEKTEEKEEKTVTERQPDQGVKIHPELPPPAPSSENEAGNVEAENTKKLLNDLNSMMTPLKDSVSQSKSFRVKMPHHHRRPATLTGERKSACPQKNCRDQPEAEKRYNNDDDEDEEADSPGFANEGYRDHFDDRPHYDFKDDRAEFHDDPDDFPEEDPNFRERPYTQENEEHPDAYKHRHHGFQAPFDNPPAPPPRPKQEEAADWRFEGGHHFNNNHGLFENRKPDFFRDKYKPHGYTSRAQVKTKLAKLNNLLNHVLPLDLAPKPPLAGMVAMTQMRTGDKALVKPAADVFFNTPSAISEPGEEASSTTE